MLQRVSLAERALFNARKRSKVSNCQGDTSASALSDNYSCGELRNAESWKENVENVENASPISAALNEEPEERIVDECATHCGRINAFEDEGNDNRRMSGRDTAGM